MDVERKEEFKRRFRDFDDEQLIENVFRPLTEEACEATREVLEERGLAGDALQLRVNAVRKEIVTRSGVSNHCDYCGQSVLVGAIRSAGQRFCSERCRDESALLAKSVDLAPDLIYEHAIRMKYGKCPECGVVGNHVEMWPTWHLFSAIYIVHASRKAELRCRACACKASIRAAASCLLFGWWSIYGFFATPVSIIRNLRVGFASKVEDEPSDALLMRARIELARQIPDFSDLQSNYPAVASGERLG
jgi:endogenous inhibitor of DNA gyrase (YacG/DUF329 family)